jgi:hypothetical protein
MMPMEFRYPVKGKSSDLALRKECAPLGMSAIDTKIGTGAGILDRHSMRKSIICTASSKLLSSGQQNKLGTVYIALNSSLAAKSVVVAAELLV